MIESSKKEPCGMIQNAKKVPCGMIQNVKAIFWKQIKETFKNKAIFIQFVMFPVMTIIMENAVKIEGMQAHFFASLFAVMYVGMAPLVSMASILSEEKEKNTLRVLLMANVRPTDYLLGIGCYIWTLCMTGAAVIGIGGGYRGRALLFFLLFMGFGILISIVVGASIGSISKNQMMATSITVPAMMILSFLPMVSMFNQTVANIARFTYSEQLRILISQPERFELSAEMIVVLSVNTILALALFVFAYKKCGLES